VDLPEEAKRAPPAPVWNQSFPSPKALFVRGTFFIRCYRLVHSRGRSPIRNLGTRVAAVVPQLASGTATDTDTTVYHVTVVRVSYLLLKGESRDVCFVAAPHDNVTLCRDDVTLRHDDVTLRES